MINPMKKAIFYIFIILLLLFVSCEKEQPNIDVTEPLVVNDNVVENKTSEENVETIPLEVISVEVEEEKNEGKEDEITHLEKPLTLIDKFSYVYGITDFESIINTPDFNLFYYLKGIVDAYYEDVYFTNQEMNEIFSQYYELLLLQSEEELIKLRESNLKAAESFLKSNGLRDGVEETVTGIQFEVLREGYEEGRTPKDNDIVLVNYQLITLSGQIKESTYLTSEAVELKVNSGVRGFQQALKVMKEGEKIRVWIHPNLGYGISGSGNVMPNEMLIYDIELLMIKDNV